METIKQIVYRDSDGALVIVANNPEVDIIPRFLKDFTSEQNQVIEKLIVFALTKITDIKYVVYLSEGNTLNLESNQEENISLIVSDLDSIDKSIVDEWLDLCKKLINI